LDGGMMWSREDYTTNNEDGNNAGDASE